MKTQVIIDADFLNIFLSIENGATLFEEIMDALDFFPVMHPYVADHELDTNTKAQQLIKKNVIKRFSYDEIYDEKYEQYYKMQFENYYKYMNNKELTTGKIDIFHYRKAGENLGEIHSCIMAHFLKIEYFMSNDRGAKDLVKTRVNNGKFQLNVLSYLDFLHLLIENKEKMDSNLRKKVSDCLLSVKSGGNYIIGKHDAQFIREQLKELV